MYLAKPCRDYLNNDPPGYITADQVTNMPVTSAESFTIQFSAPVSDFQVTVTQGDGSTHPDESNTINIHAPDSGVSDIWTFDFNPTNGANGDDMQGHSYDFSIVAFDPDTGDEIDQMPFSYFQYIDSSSGSPVTIANAIPVSLLPRPITDSEAQAMQAASVPIQYYDSSSGTFINVPSSKLQSGALVFDLSGNYNVTSPSLAGDFTSTLLLKR